MKVVLRLADRARLGGISLLELPIYLLAVSDPTYS